MNWKCMLYRVAEFGTVLFMFFVFTLFMIVGNA